MANCATLVNGKVCGHDRGDHVVGKGRCDWCGCGQFQPAAAPNEFCKHVGCVNRFEMEHKFHRILPKAAEPTEPPAPLLKKCTCPTQAYYPGSSEMNESYCVLTEEEHAKLKEPKPSAVGGRERVKVEPLGDNHWILRFRDRIIGQDTNELHAHGMAVGYEEGFADALASPALSGQPLHELRVSTHDPDKYELVNHEDGTRWRGSKDGWKKG